VVFHSLTPEQLLAIVEIQVRHLQGRLQDKGIELELTPPAKEHLARIGYDPVYGARPLKRAIQRELETPLAKKILEGEIKDNSRVVADMKGDAIVFKSEEKKTPSAG